METYSSILFSKHAQLTGDVTCSKFRETVRICQWDTLQYWKIWSKKYLETKSSILWENPSI